LAIPFAFASPSLISTNCSRRLQTLNVNGQQVETVGIPLHWGFEGVARKGYIALAADFHPVAVGNPFRFCQPFANFDKLFRLRDGLYEEDAIRLGKKDKFPYVGTTYRLTEHFHTWTKHDFHPVAVGNPFRFCQPFANFDKLFRLRDGIEQRMLQPGGAFV
jgi:hypothetical protein